MPAYGRFKAKPPSVNAAPYESFYDAVQTIAQMINAKSTKVDSSTNKAEFTLDPPLEGGVPFVLEVEIDSMVVQGGGRPYVMSKQEFYELYEAY